MLGRAKHHTPSAQHPAAVPDTEMPHAIEIAQHTASDQRPIAASGSICDPTDATEAEHDTPLAQLSVDEPDTVLSYAEEVDQHSPSAQHLVAVLDTG